MIKSMDLNILILVEQHVRTNGHNSNRDRKFTFIEIIEKIPTWNQLLIKKKKKEDKW